MSSLPSIKQKAINKAARRLVYWCKQVVELGPQGSARYMMLDKLRREMNAALRMSNHKGI